jgi:hypothetical protein
MPATALQLITASGPYGGKRRRTALGRLLLADCCRPMYGSSRPKADIAAFIKEKRQFLLVDAYGRLFQHHSPKAACQARTVRDLLAVLKQNSPDAGVSLSLPERGCTLMAKRRSRFVCHWASRCRYRPLIAAAAPMSCRSSQPGDRRPLLPLVLFQDADVQLLPQAQELVAVVLVDQHDIPAVVAAP